MAIKVVVHMAKKRSRLTLWIAVVLVVVIVLALIVFLGAQFNQARAPGVKAGDEFTYDIRGSWSSNDPNVTAPASFLQLNMTESYKITVTDVNGSKVSISTSWRFENGTERNTTGYVDIESGTTFPSGGFWPIFAANLKANDILRPSGMELVTINETKTSDYGAGVTRETNVVSQTRELYDADDPTGSTLWNQYVTIQFDRQTGMLVKLSDASVYNNPQLILNNIWTLKESNIWSVS
jgi:hypothetical protein